VALNSPEALLAMAGGSSNPLRVAPKVLDSSFPGAAALSGNTVREIPTKTALINCLFMFSPFGLTGVGK
jgi:hypothetical protein